MISNLLLALEKEAVNYPANSSLIEELLSFRKDGKKLEAPPGKHDDCVMSACFALSVSPFNQERVGFSFGSLRVI